MASTQQIDKAAKDLGRMIAEHSATAALKKVRDELDKDVETQRLLTDLDRHVQTISEKQQQGKPIEVDDKHKLEKLQNAVSSNDLVRRYQVAQMDYLDLMRRVHQSIAEAAGDGEDEPAGDFQSVDVAGRIEPKE